MQECWRWCSWLNVSVTCMRSISLIYLSAHDADNHHWLEITLCHPSSFNHYTAHYTVMISACLSLTLMLNTEPQNWIIPWHSAWLTALSHSLLTIYVLYTSCPACGVMWQVQELCSGEKKSTKRHLCRKLCWWLKYSNIFICILQIYWNDVICHFSRFCSGSVKR